MAMHVLTIDGGGIRGLVPAMLLAEVERRAGRPISTLFHLVAGSSTGSLLAAALTTPGPDGDSRYTAAEVVERFEASARALFNHSRVHKAATLSGLVGPRYTANRMQKVLLDLFDEVRLRDARSELLIPYYDIDSGHLQFFKRRTARADARHDHRLCDVIQVATSAPSFFPPVRLTDDAGVSRTAIDAGAFIANLSMCAYAELLATGHAGEPCVFLSLGTGLLPQPLPYEKVKDWGAAQWVQPIMFIVPDGYSEAADYQVRQCLQAYAPQHHYARIQFPLDGASLSLDDVSEENLDALKALSTRLIHDRDREIDALCAALG